MLLHQNTAWFGDSLLPSVLSHSDEPNTTSSKRFDRKRVAFFYFFEIQTSKKPQRGASASVHGAEERRPVTDGQTSLQIHLFLGAVVSEQGLIMSVQLRVTQVTSAGGLLREMLTAAFSRQRRCGCSRTRLCSTKRSCFTLSEPPWPHTGSPSFNRER